MFLDVESDRFFCLGDEAQQTIAELEVSDSCSKGLLEAAERLAGRGLLVARPGDNAVTPCRPPSFAETSLLDREISSPYWQIVPAMTALVRARSALKLFGLRRVLRDLERRKGSARLAANRALIDHTAAAFYQAALIMTPLDLCLPRSLALTAKLASQGAQPEMVIGVRLEPFAAHAWVQFGNELLNERADVVREFTPVRVI